MTTSTAIIQYINHLLSTSEEVTLLDGTRGRAAQLQLGLLGKIYAGAVTAVQLDGDEEPLFGLFKILTTGEDPDGSKIMVEVVIQGESIMSVERMVDSQRGRILKAID